MKLWGETIEKVAIFFVLAMAMAAFAVPAMAQSGMIGSGGVDILGTGIFETGNNAFKFPQGTDINFDSIKVGNDRALAIGGTAQFAGGFSSNLAAVTAQNNLKIKKNQDVGECACCQTGDAANPCKDCCVQYNVEQIDVGNRNAMALGLSLQGAFPFSRNTASTLAQNNVEIVTNQQ
ncbi:MAG TPA: hypothetical protein PKK11_04140 [Methanothrix sp.]|nr:hypothetical protein [Methanothrix sp.]HPT18667.1 hypothetical protein [Methanothrix sp.]